MKSVVLTDVHGCLPEVKKLLGLVSFDSSKDRLIFLGDMMDRGFYSYETFLFFRDLKEKMGERCILVRGNHDHLLLKKRISLYERAKWYFGGRFLTDWSFLRHGEKLSAAASWIMDNMVFFHEEPSFLCVHASLENCPLEENSLETLLNNHFLTRKNVYRGKLALTGHSHLRRPMYYNGSGGKGQTLPYGTEMVLPKTGIICLDTGCGEGNRLTAMVVEGNHYHLESVKRGAF